VSGANSNNAASDSIELRLYTVTPFSTKKVSYCHRDNYKKTKV